MMIPFNKPYYTGREILYVRDAFERLQTAGNGFFTKQCQNFFEKRYGFKKCLLTQSCTAALEMCALLADVGPGDEVIMPSYTFVSTSNAFVLRGATIRFADSEAGRPHVDAEDIERLITPRTRVIVVVHYGGTAVNMRDVKKIAQKHNLLVVEDTAHALDSSYFGEPLGKFGDLAAFSFHETKNIICGEGGMLAINNPRLRERSEILWEKGTNRSAFFRGEVAKYQWVDIGSSFLPSELTAAVLFAQLEHLEDIQARRVSIWHRYNELLQPLATRENLQLPLINEGETVNGHLYYLVCRSFDERTALIEHLKARGIQAVFHYQSLHSSPFYAAKHGDRPLPRSDLYTDRLIRLPFYYEMDDAAIKLTASSISEYYGNE